MSLSIVAPLFIGPAMFLVSALLACVLILVVVRVVFSIARRILTIAGVVFGVRWVLGVVGVGPL